MTLKPVSIKTSCSLYMGTVVTFVVVNESVQYVQLVLGMHVCVCVYVCVCVCVCV